MFIYLMYQLLSILNYSSNKSQTLVNRFIDKRLNEISHNNKNKLKYVKHLNKYKPIIVKSYSSNSVSYKILTIKLNKFDKWYLLANGKYLTTSDDLITCMHYYYIILRNRPHDINDLI